MAFMAELQEVKEDERRGETQAEVFGKARGDERRAEQSPTKADPTDEARDQPEEQEDDQGGGIKIDPKKRKASRRPLIIGLIISALVAIGGGYYWYLNRNIESTDDSYTDGRAISIAPQISGTVVSLDVNDNQFVHKGDPLIHIDPRQYENSRNQAEGVLLIAQAQLGAETLNAEIARKNFPALLQQSDAQVLQAEAALVRAQADYNRQKSLPKPATTQQDVDSATAALKQAEAQVQLAKAQVVQNSPVQQRIGTADRQVAQLKGQVEQQQANLDQASLNLSWTVVTAPQDGWITKRNVETGNYVTPGQQIFSIVSPEVWVTANFKETQLDQMRPGQKVTIEVDAYPHLKLEGHVDSIQLGSGSKFTAFPPENATGNFIKIVQRIPVKILIDSGLSPDLPLPLGISVVPRVTLQ
jgi:membrane fusion protein (multidrug efflux system)